MAGRPKIYDEDIAIECATNVFWESSYDAASADVLLKSMGIGKGSFYLNFKGGKEELYERSLEFFSNKFYNRLIVNLNQAKDKIDFIKKFFLALADDTDVAMEKGCYLGNALVQLGDKNEKLRLDAAALLDRMRKAFVEVIREAQASGRLTTKEPAELLAWHLSNLWNGIQVTRRMQQSPKTLRSLIKLNLAILV